MNKAVLVRKDQLNEYCRAHGIVRLAIFGSALRPDFGPESDIDMLVEFESSRTPSLLGMVRMERDFSEILGREVDLVERVAVEQSRNYVRRAAILNSVETIYAAG